MTAVFVSNFRRSNLSAFLFSTVNDETTHPVILFDGVCNFCNASINFIIKQDKKKIFRFAALQSEAGQKLLERYNLSKKNFKSFVLIDQGKVYQKSSAG